MNGEQQHAEDLLVDRVTEGLSPEADHELESLLVGLPQLDVESFELAASAIDMAFDTGPKPAMPNSLRKRLSDQAAAYYAGRDAQSSAELSEPADVLNFPTPSHPAATQRSRWASTVAIAASLLLAVAGWAAFWSVRSPQVAAPPVALTQSQAREALVGNASDLVQLSWTATEDPAATGASGDVAWSVERQEGYMRFAGLPANDPTVEQYQLWIFDTAQDERYPIDGGVFDIPPSATGEVVVPIKAKLNVTKPTLFAITIEKPGGVVVSSRERLPLLAQVG